MSDGNMIAPPAERVLLIVGAFGCGKTEITLNLARSWSKWGPLAVVDFDHVTPYFRSRQAKELARAWGVEVIAPSGDPGHFTTPSIPAEVPAALLDSSRRVVFDVGGDEQGARALAQLGPALRQAKVSVWLVVNSRRPETRTGEAAATMATEIQDTGRIEVTGVVANGNLGPATTLEVVAEGLEVGRECAALLRCPVVLTVCPEALAPAARERWPEMPVLPLRFYLRPTWLQ